jgi:ParB family chromosome partitioning protein
MSLKDLKKKSASALADTPAKALTPRKPVTSPGQLMAFQGEMIAAEDRIKALEARVRDLEASAIAIDGISANPWQPRRVFDEAEIQKLAGSIAEVGLIQPIIVRRSKSVSNTDTPKSDSENVSITDTPYQLVAGERRLRACRALGRVDIRAIVVEATDEEMAALALAENVDREDLTDYEIAVAIRNAESAFPSRKSLASCLGINRTELYQYLSFFNLPKALVKDLDANPRLLGRNAAEDIVATIRKHGAPAADVVLKVWARFKAGDIEQGKISGLIETGIQRDRLPRTERDIKKLFVGKEQAGSITRDASAVTIKIRTAAISSDKESRLRDFVQQLLVDPD